MTPAARAKGNNILTYRNLDIPCKLLLISRLGLYMSGVLGGITNGEAYPRGFPTGSKQDIAKVRQIRFAFTGHFQKPQNVITNGIHISIQAGRGGRAYTGGGGGGVAYNMMYSFCLQAGL